MSVVGGDSGSVGAGGDGLATAAGAVGGASSGINSAGGQAEGAAGDPRVSAAMSRFTAAWSQTTTDLQTEMQAAAMLARNAAADLATAGGSPR